MATIQIVNVSTPNDGLGDNLRASQVKRNANEAELNAKKVEKVAGFDLSQNNYTDAEKAKLAGVQAGAEVNVQANWNQTDPSQDDYIIGKPTNGKIITFGIYSLVGQVLTIFPNWMWVINDIVYTNTSNIIINIPFCTTGKQRIDLIVFDNLNSAQRVEGDEVVSSPITPNMIDNSVLFGSILVTDSTVGNPTIPSNTQPSSIDYPLLVSATQNFTIPIGRNASRVWVNNAPWFKLSSNNTTKSNTFTQSINVVTTKTALAINNYVVIDLQ